MTPTVGIADDEIIIDGFAGGGGASDGIELALEDIGRHVDIAINHDPEAIAMHAANHPHTKHLCENVWRVDIKKEVAGRKVGLAWLSPDCTHHSRAKGGKPVKKEIRALAWVLLRWIGELGPISKPRVICLENVEEYQDWGMVHRMPRSRRDREKCKLCKRKYDGRPCPNHKGVTFKRWCTQVRNLGYDLEFRRMRASHYGAPTSRMRLFIVMRCDGQPIVWPEATHGKTGSGLLPYRTAAECIDWSIPCPSIFLTNKEAKKLGVIRPLAENTMRRIARGVKRYVLDSPKPFIVQTGYGERPGQQPRVPDIGKPLGTVVAGGVVVPTITPICHYDGTDRTNAADKPLPTITASKTGSMYALTSVFLSSFYGAKSPDGDSRGRDVDQPVPTVPTENRHALVTAFLAQHNKERGGRVNPGKAATDPLSTITTTGRQQSIIASSLVKLRGTCRDGQRVDEPAPTISAQGTHIAEVRAFLIKYFGTDQDPRLDQPMHTVTSKHRFALGVVWLEGEPWQIVDIGMRMLTPRELFNAQGFRRDYIISGGRDVCNSQGGLFVGSEWIELTQTAQIRMCGNSVSPPPAEALIRANFGLQNSRRERAAA